MTSLRSARPGTPKAKAYQLSCRPVELMTLARATQRDFETIPLEELGTWAEGLKLALRRERAKSVARHWSYDLNRHIALKRARDEILSVLADRTGRDETG